MLMHPLFKFFFLLLFLPFVSCSQATYNTATFDVGTKSKPILGIWHAQITYPTINKDTSESTTKFPTFLFVSGFGGEYSIEEYKQVLSQIASHGVIIIGVDRKFKLQPVVNYTYLASSLQTVINYYNQGQLASALLNASITTAGIPGNLLVGGHSAGNHVIVRRLNNFFLSTNASGVIMIDPVDGEDPFGIVKQYVIHPPAKVNFNLPALHIATGLDPKGHPPCAPAKMSNDRFYNAWVGDIWSMNYTQVGHMDCTNDGGSLSKVICPSSKNKTIEPIYRSLIGQSVNAFITRDINVLEGLTKVNEMNILYKHKTESIMKVPKVTSLVSPNTTLIIPITPIEMQKLMGIGINLGNTLDAPKEGSWAPAAKETYFDEYKSKKFTNVRIPIQWGHHMSTTSPFEVDDVFMSRVEEIVDWSLSRNLITIINTHHDEWFENNYPSSLKQFESLWEQIASKFANKSEKLLFEIYNEPHAPTFTKDDLNTMNQRILPIIRKTNPTRIVILGGLKFMNPSWEISNPNELWIPTNDTQLMLEIHNYDPYKYAGPQPTLHEWGSNDDINALNKWMDEISTWSNLNRLPIYYGEFGCTTTQTKETGRYLWYSHHAESIRSHGFAASVWDDDGGFRVYDRVNNTWDEDLLNALDKA